MTKGRSNRELNNLLNSNVEFYGDRKRKTRSPSDMRGDEVELVGSVTAKMSKNIETRKTRIALNGLLGMGFLEGEPVSYKMNKEECGDALPGVIKGKDIICYCGDCNGNRVVSPNVFEIHAHSKNKRAADYIYLMNGTNLRYVLDACQNAPLESWESIVGSICSSTEAHMFCRKCKRSFTEGVGNGMRLCQSCKLIKKTKRSPASIHVEEVPSQLGSTSVCATEDSQPNLAQIE